MHVCICYVVMNGLSPVIDMIFYILVNVYSYRLRQILVIIIDSLQQFCQSRWI